MHVYTPSEGLPWWLSCKESACQCRRWRFNPWVRKIPWRGKLQPTPVFLPGKPHGQRNLSNYSPWGHRRVRHDLATATAATRIEELCIHKFPSWVYIWGCVLYRILGTLNLYCFEISLPTIFHSGSVRRQWNGRKKNLLKF